MRTRATPDPAVLERMAGALVHRGPDDAGIWHDAEAGIGLVHRRLSIVDLSPSGHQPMKSADGRLILVFNGEIYNHAELRTALDAEFPRNWRGHSDTETLLECIAAWGLRQALERSVGMFALALWDRRDRRLALARDRFGEKPLYYGWVERDFLFASELKAIRRHPRFDNPVSRDALRLLMARNYVPAPFSIHERIFKLEPGCILTIDGDAAATPRIEAPRAGEDTDGIRLERYWSYRAVVEAGLDDPISDEREALERLESALGEAIRGQSVADVPVGAFLSGGIDSSTIVALYRKYSPGRVKTFSIGFAEAGFDEAAYAKQVARHFGTEHDERYVTAAEAQAVIPRLPQIYDEPFADSSQIPTHLVCAFAREQVTVALSGDAGDELFGGYNRYVRVALMWARLRRLPAPLRAVAGGSVAMLPPQLWNALSPLMPGGRRPAFFGAKVQKAFATMASARSLDDVFADFIDEWPRGRSPVVPNAPLPDRAGFDLGVEAPDAVRMMYCDAVSYLPDDILCKVDRAAMAVSLETRVPFLDHRLAALAARIPLGMKIRGGTGKHILRQLLYRHAPEALFDRPKAGFAVPIGEWLKGPLRDWAEALLDPSALRRHGYFDADRVQLRWRQHLGGRDSTAAIWSILMFQSWLAENT